MHVPSSVLQSFEPAEARWILDKSESFTILLNMLVKYGRDWIECFSLNVSIDVFRDKEEILNKR